MCAFVLSVPSNSAKPGEEQGSMCLEFMHIGRPIEALDRSPGTCASSQEFFKNNCLARPSKTVPQQPLQPPGGKKTPIPKCGYLQGTLHRTKTPNWNQDLDLPLRRKERFPSAGLPLLISYTSVVSENCKTVFTSFCTAWGCPSAARYERAGSLYNSAT